MQIDDGHFEVRLATDAEDLRAAQRLRYEVFVGELGGDGPLVDHQARLEQDRFDPYFDHLMLLDHRRAAGDQVVGVYRLMGDAQARAAGQFYSEDEYDLQVLKRSGRRLLELGRSCLHAEYRGGSAMMHLWNGLAAYVSAREIEVMFGVASFHGTDIGPLAQPLSFLHHRHLAPVDIRVRARAEAFQRMDLVPEEQLDRPAATRAIPSLIKAYLRLGGFVGEGAFIDRPFNCVDVCLIMDTARMSDRHRAIYQKGASA
ncbi:GNAT family N-acetyltransferase [Roseobacter sp. HKCCD9010]|uniref:GNAT family N-acetyltransferase n=1 Tax=unclassified Roseobacter TaxID=196798 RepID=UPI001492CFA0|nr:MULTISPECIES: GNAT family N-acyltransferase [unclassified Roseobacter]MBF9050520.1 GNAT family N-acetyltransferase [Rhodobacterales bacterium HKCCD4356]NNV12063.1 GNAT family N-acetyltransferase [Roseobacter sp. HKCCD7357]NNV17077.1 GNAT family N-acetyltransferase [Roseobacter sp. HKCCD8768]NNV26306.1 GNAT family N-acetyltransferase [Roseobacter sp. HKCCD8192]NNV30801.1 GNAT family N-acetyltransferase [Roseobacter sp. HKCCD9061]